jgi:hypothetical protein
LNYVLVRSTSCEVDGDFGLLCYSQLLGDFDCTSGRMSATRLVNSLRHNL